MKRLISLLSGFGIITSMTTVDVSCSRSQFYNDIFVITDDGTITDLSFNTAVYNGAQTFISQILNGKQDAPYIQPKSKNFEDLNAAYNKAYVENNTDISILSGYVHNIGDGTDKSIGGNAAYNKLISDKKGKSAVIIDTESAGNKTIGVEFRADISGFYAGFSSILWNLINKKFNDNNPEITLSAFAGMLADSQVSVASYLVGFFSSIYTWQSLIIDFNENKSTSVLYDLVKKYSNDVTQNNLTKLFSNKNWESSCIKQENYNPGSDTDPNWVSGSFTVGEGLSLCKKLLASNPDIFMPVAGQQTEDALIVLKNYYPTFRTKIIGVDSDATLGYSGYKGKIITSGLKNIAQGTVAAISRTQKYHTNNQVIKNVNKYLNDNKNVFFTDDNDNEINFDVNKSWSVLEGKNIWLSGDIAHGGNNLITDDLYNDVLGVCPISALMIGSDQFKKDAKSGEYQSYQLLNTDYLTEFGNATAKNIINYFKNN